MRKVTIRSPWLEFDLERWRPVLNPDFLREYKKDSVLYLQDEPVGHVYIVSEGCVRLCVIAQNGSQSQMYFAKRGCLVGEAGNLQDAISDMTAYAFSDSMIYAVPATVFREEVNQAKELMLTFCAMQAEKMSLLSTQLIEKSLLQPHERVIVSLVNYANECGVPLGGDVEVDFKQDIIVDMSHSTRLTVSRTIKELMREGLLEKSRGRYIIKDMQSLTEKIYGMLE